MNLTCLQKPDMKYLQGSFCLARVASSSFLAAAASLSCCWALQAASFCRRWALLLGRFVPAGVGKVLQSHTQNLIPPKCVVSYPGLIPRPHSPKNVISYSDLISPKGIASYPDLIPPKCGLIPRLHSPKMCSLIPRLHSPKTCT